jgi:hypothetical protein
MDRGGGLRRASMMTGMSTAEFLWWIGLAAYGVNLLALIVVAVRTYGRLSRQEIYMFLCTCDVLAALPMGAVLAKWFSVWLNWGQGGVNPLLAQCVTWLSNAVSITLLVIFPLFVLSAAVLILSLITVASERRHRSAPGDRKDGSRREGLSLLRSLSCIHHILVWIMLGVALATGLVGR